MFALGQSQKAWNEAKTSNNQEKDKHLDTFFECTLCRKGKPIPSDETVNIFVTGCPDGNVTAQTEVFNHMLQMIEKNYKNIPPLFIIGLGDNGSSTGTKNPGSNFFRKYFHDIYPFSQPCFTALGNHDVNAHDGMIDRDRAYAQIAHTYYASGKIDPKKKALFEHPKNMLDLDALTQHPNKWNMPGRYGVLHCGNADIFFADSNTLAEDFRKQFLNPSETSPKLVGALFEAIKKSVDAGKKIILVLHHPLRTIDKRIFHSDHENYLPSSSIKILQEHRIIGEKFNYNDILTNILFFAGNKEKNIPEGPGKHISLVLAAHHHANHYFNNDFSNKASSKYDSMSEDEKKQDKTGHFPYPLTQAVVGAGGCGTQPASSHPGLQNRYSFADDKYQAFFGKALGFLALQIYTNKTMRFVFHTVDEKIPKNRIPGIHNLELHFTNLSNDPLDEMRVTDKRFIFLHDTLFEACKIFLENNFPEAPTKFGGVIESIGPDFLYADYLRNFFNNYTRPTFEEAVHFIKSTRGAWHKLYIVFENHFKTRNTGETLDEFFSHKEGNLPDPKPNLFTSSPKPASRLNATETQAERKTNITTTYTNT